MTVGGQRQRQGEGEGGGEGESVHKCTKNNAKAKNAKTEMIKKDMRTPKRPCPSNRLERPRPHGKMPQMQRPCKFSSFPF